MLQAIALDNDRFALEMLDTFCQQTGHVTLARAFTRPAEARHYIRHNRVDLVFLEINLPTESGIDFWQSIRAHIADSTEQRNGLLPMVIFTTASREFAIASYDLQAVDYLLKPFSLERFAQAVQKATAYVHWQQLASVQSAAYLSLRVDSGLVRINTADIAWIEALSNYLKIYLSDQRFVVVRMTMKAMLQELPSTNFVRVHRSFIIPIHRVQAVHNKLIHIGEAQIPLSSNYDDAFYAQIRKYQSSSQILPTSSHTSVCLQQL